MADNSNIQWTDATWNPLIGCSKISPGCANCYAEKMAGRLACMRQKPYEGVIQWKSACSGLRYSGNAKQASGTSTAIWTGKTAFIKSALIKPLRWRKPRKIFVCSMSDLFHESVPFEWIDRVFAVMALCPQHTFQVLTKRAKRMREYFTTRTWGDVIASMRHEADREPPFGPATVASRVASAYQFDDWLSGTRQGSATGMYVDVGHKPRLPQQWPLPNVWMGVTVEDQKRADERIPHLLATPAAVRFLSVEPMLEAVDLTGWGSAAPSFDVATMPRSWTEYVWPDWVPVEQRKQIEDFWSEKCSRGPQAWALDHQHQRVPMTGARVMCQVRDGWADVDKRCHEGIAGRYLHSWNNIGRVITDDGRTIHASGGIGSGWMGRRLGLDANYRHELHWVIVGGESGPNARPCNVEWIRSIVEQCKTAGVACFVKQMGAKPYEMAFNGPAVRSWGEATIQPNGEFVQIHLKNGKGGDPSEWPEDLRVREWPPSAWPSGSAGSTD